MKLSSVLSGSEARRDLLVGSIAFVKPAANAPGPIERAAMIVAVSGASWAGIIMAAQAFLG